MAAITQLLICSGAGGAAAPAAGLNLAAGRSLQGARLNRHMRVQVVNVGGGGAISHSGTGALVAQQALIAGTGVHTGPLVPGLDLRRSGHDGSRVGRHLFAVILALAAAPPAPGVPTSLIAGTPGSDHIPLSCIAPVVDGSHGAALTYTFEVSNAGVGDWFAAPPYSTPYIDFGGLSPDSPYDFHVRASNASGSSAFTATITARTAVLSSGGQVYADTYADSYTG
jgi:hypothetical protein